MTLTKAYSLCLLIQVQMLDARSQQWSILRSQPGSALGSGNCAVAAGRFIFLIGGFHRKSGSRGCSRRNEVDQDQVLILDTSSGSWRRGPSLLTRRRGHGCTVVDVAGRFVRFLSLPPKYSFSDSFYLEFRELWWLAARISATNFSVQLNSSISGKI